MEDIAPKLIEEIEKTFNRKVKKDIFISSFLKKVKQGEVDFIDTQTYSRKLGVILGDTFKEVLREDVLPDGRLYWNIAERTMLPMLNNNYELVNAASIEVQKILDVKEGIGLKPIKSKRPDERIKGVLDNVTVEGLAFAEVQKRMTEPVENITQSFFDDFVKENADFRHKVGLKPKIIRILKGSKTCKWCKQLAGEYDYEEIKKSGNDVFRRHENCKCQVVYATSNEIQDVYSKKVSKI